MKGTLVLCALIMLVVTALGQTDGTSVESQRALIDESCAGCQPLGDPLESLGIIRPCIPANPHISPIGPEKELCASSSAKSISEKFSS